MTKSIPETDLKSLRKKLGLTQKEFAGKYYIELDTLRNWEQKRSFPVGGTKLLLFLIEENFEGIDLILKKHGLL